MAKQVGETVQKRAPPIFEISTDKVDAEIPSPITGILTEIKTAEGTTVEVNTVVAVIGGSATGASITAAPQTPPYCGSTKPDATLAQQQAPSPSAQAGEDRVRSSPPRSARIAKENSADLARVPGTGSDGRITKDDILRYISMPAAQRTAAPPLIQPPSGTSSAKSAYRCRVVPLTKMRSIIAQRMVESKRISPHVHSVYKIDMTRIVRLREREKSAFEQRTGVKLTYMPFIAVAAIEALRRYPIVNAPSTTPRPLPRQHQPRHRRRARVGTNRAHRPRSRAAQLL